MDTFSPQKRIQSTFIYKNVSESFNYVSDLLKFTTEGYVILFAMDIFQIKDMNEDIQNDDKEEILNFVSEKIVDKVWREIDMVAKES
jgi:predicted SpoU family rRNA methylase